MPLTTDKPTAEMLESMADANLTDEAEWFCTDIVDDEFSQAVRIDRDGSVMPSKVTIRYTGANTSKNWCPMFTRTLEVSVRAGVKVVGYRGANDPPSVQDERYYAIDEMPEDAEEIYLDRMIHVTHVATAYDGDDCVMLYEIRGG